MLVRSFVKICQLIQKLSGTHARTHTPPYTKILLPPPLKEESKLLRPITICPFHLVQGYSK